MSQEKHEEHDEDPPIDEDKEVDADADVDVSAEISPRMNISLRDICILPPVPTDIEAGSEKERKLLVKDAILLPPISPSEPVSAIRGAISEIRGYAHITNYRLVLVEDTLEDQLVNDIREETKRRMDGSAATAVAASSDKDTASGNGNGLSGKKKKKKVKSVPPLKVISPYTCDQKSVQPSASSFPTGIDSEEIVLNDFEDLTLLAGSGQLQSGSGLRMVLERYNLGNIKDQVFKTRFLFDGNAPSVLSVIGGTPASEVPKEDADGENSNIENGEQGVELGDEAKKEIEESKNRLEIDPNELKIPVFSAGSVNMSSNLEDFFYLSTGEEERLAIVKGKSFLNQPLEVNRDDADLLGGNGKNLSASAPNAHATAKAFVQLEEKCKVDCSISFGGFNPPPDQRLLVGDLAYLEVALPGGEGTVHITAMPTGFYVNKSSGSSEDGSKSMKFDPTPAPQPCFSHTLLDCLLLKSPALRIAWAEALEASLMRSEISAMNQNDPLQAIFRAATYGDLVGNVSHSDSLKMFDSATLRPSWLVPMPHSSEASVTNVAKPIPSHNHDLSRSEEEIGNKFGIDFRNGAARDWNEEIQLAREMPIETIDQRIERARMIHKTLCDFADAAAAGVKGIFSGQISAMNPNEEARAHVYLHNNIFFSRTIDSGVDTFKITRGDKCARKSASRDAACVGMLHKLDNPDINTLATVLVDYLGTRMVCQSIVPGILLGEKTHQILYGAVEAASPLKCDEGFHKKIENTLGKAFMIATRKVPRMLLKDEVAQEEKDGKITPDASKEKLQEAPECIDYFGSIELKGIRGSDCRDYCLDTTRLTPRDANWVSKENGGTGNWEKFDSSLAVNLDDDEWIVAVSRQELIARFTNFKMREFIKSKKDAKSIQNEGAHDENTDTDTGLRRKEEEEEYLKSLRVNLNVFLPHFKKIEKTDREAFLQMQKDEELVREIACYLWDSILPQITRDVRDAQGQIPIDGKSLTNFLHERGVNCRYMGRLAKLACEEEDADEQEEQDLINGKIKTLRRRSMPSCWLELLECEMVARAAKYVLDGYLLQSGGSAAYQPSKVVASFLSALVCSSEESAADTEKRLNEDNENAEENQITFFDGCADNLHFRSRGEVWIDIESEVQRRFMYNLKIFNRTDSKSARRASLVSLLRRVCQRSGIRLFAKNYAIGGKGLTSLSSYPIAADDVAAILPTIKHAAHDGREGFVSCRNGAAAANAYLHIVLEDAHNTYEAAHMLLNERKFSLALEYSQEATNLYQRITDTALHAKVLKCMEITTLILFQAEEREMAVANAAKALAISMQIGGFDNSDVVSAHQTYAHILLKNGHLTSSIKNMRAVLYLAQLLGGVHHVELSALYQKIGSIYDEVGNVSVASHFLMTAMSRKNNDRVIQGVLAKQLAAIYSKIGQWPGAVEMEKQAYSIFRITLGEGHEYSQHSKKTLEHYIKDATEKGKAIAAKEKKRLEEAKANKIADEIVAREIAEEKKKKKKKSKTKSKKKK